LHSSNHLRASRVAAVPFFFFGAAFGMGAAVGALFLFFGGITTASGGRNGLLAATGSSPDLF